MKTTIELPKKLDIKEGDKDAALALAKSWEAVSTVAIWDTSSNSNSSSPLATAQSWTNKSLIEVLERKEIDCCLYSSVDLWDCEGTPSILFKPVFETLVPIQSITLPTPGINNYVVNWGDGSELEIVTTSITEHTYTLADSYTAIINTVYEFIIDVDKHIVLPTDGIENYIVDWGDGTELETITSVNPSHVYTSIGTYTVLLTSTNALTVIDNESIVLPTIALPSADIISYTVDWGDDAVEELIAIANINPVHIYEEPGVYVVEIEGLCPTWDFFQVQDSNNLLVDVINWGSVGLTSGNNMFYRCVNFYRITAKDVFDIEGLVTDVSYMFYDCNMLPGVDVNSLIPINAITVSHMFDNCNFLVRINTKYNSNMLLENVEDFSYMFANCYRLPKLDLIRWDLPKAINFEGFFYNCFNITTLDFKPWKVSTVQNYNRMFENCFNILSLDIIDLDVSSAITMSEMFKSCYSLPLLDITAWDVSSVVDISYIFEYCYNFTTLDITTWDTSNIQNYSGMFKNCSELDLDLSVLDTSAALNLSHMFEGCDMPTLDMSAWNTSNVTNFSYMFKYFISSVLDVGGLIITSGTDFSFMFSNCNNLSELLVPDWHISQPANFSNMFEYCTSLLDIDLSTWIITASVDFSYMFNFNYLETIDLSNWHLTSATNFTHMFFSSFNLVTANLSGWNTTGATDFEYMFGDCKKLESLILENWTVAGDTNFQYMFNNCILLFTIDLSTWNTTNATNFSYMFYEVIFTDINVNNWDVANCVDFSYMFAYCEGITTLDLSTWDFTGTNNVSTIFDRMFYYTSYLTSLNLANWIVTGQTSFDYMFSNCYDLLTLDLSTWITTGADDFRYMFMGSRLLHLNVDNWNMSSVSDSYKMFDISAILESDLDLSSWITTGMSSTSYMFYGLNIGANVLNLSDWNMSSIINSSYMFRDSNLSNVLVPNWTLSTTTNFYFMFYYLHANIDVSTWDTSPVTSFKGTFNSYRGTTLYLDNWDVSNCEDFELMFSNCSVLQTLLVTNWNFSTTTKLIDMFLNTGRGNYTDGTHLVVDFSTWNVSTIINMFEMFHYSRFKELDLNNWSVSNVTNFSSMFYGMEYLETLKISNWDTSKATNFASMFARIGYDDIKSTGKLSLNLSGWDTSKVTSMNDMFQANYHISTLDVSNWDISNCSNNAYMFNSCSRLVEFKADNWILGTYAHSFANMFDYCKGLKKIDLSTWNTQHCNNFSFMFQRCRSLDTIDLSNWDVTSIYNMSHMFYDCWNLRSINVSTWITIDNTTVASMFRNCEALESLDLSSWLFTKSGISFYQMFHGCKLLTCISNLDTRKSQNATADLFNDNPSLISPNAEERLELEETLINWVNPNRCSLEFKTIFKVIDTITLPTPGINNYTVDWGDGVVDEITEANPVHTYASAGDYIISINGECEFWDFLTVPDSKDNLIKVKRWGYIGLTSCANMFNGCSNLTNITALDYLGQGISDFSNMFKDCISLECISNIDTTDRLIVLDMFVNTPSLLYPTENEQAFILSGIKWINPIYCTEPFKVLLNIETDNETIYIPNKKVSDYLVDWGDGTVKERITSVWPLHTYVLAGKYEIKITGSCQQFISFIGPPNIDSLNDKILEVTNWGEIDLKTCYGMFRDCHNLKTITSDTPFTDIGQFDIDTSKTYDLMFSQMFSNCTSLVCIPDLDTTDKKPDQLAYMFSNTPLLVQPTRDDIIALEALGGDSWVNPGICDQGFKIVIKLDNNNESITLPTPGINDYTVNWGDRSPLENIDSINPTHTYTLAGQYTVILKGSCQFWNFLTIPDSKDKVIEIKQWGLLELATYTSMFEDCSNLVNISAKDSLYNDITDFSNMFKDCISLKCINNLDTTSQLDTTDMFANTIALEAPDAAEQSVILFGTKWINTTSFCSSPFTLLYEIPSNDFQIILPATSTDNNFDIDWGDGTALERVIAATPSHIYAIAGEYEVSIRGICPLFNNYTAPSSIYLKEVINWGNIELTSCYRMFYTCNNLETVNSIVPFLDIGTPVSFSSMFYNCNNLVCISDLNTTHETANSGMFTNNYKLIAPNYTDQGYLQQDKGYDWINTGICDLTFSITFSVNTGESITLPTNSITNKYTIDWGDGIVENITTINPVHTYDVSGEYKIYLSGKCEVWDFSIVPVSKDNIIRINNWGTIGLLSCANMFKGCSNLEIITAEDSLLDIGSITDFSSMFEDCISLTCIHSLNTTNQINTTDMFTNTPSLNNPNASDIANILLGSEWYNSIFCTEPFITLFNVEIDGDSISLPTSGINNYNVDWGDGSPLELVIGTYPTHTYEFSGEYEITITGSLSLWNFVSVSYSREKLLEVRNWGDISLTSCYRMFYNCKNLKTIISNIPFRKMTLFSDINYGYMFYYCSSLLCMPDIDTTNNTDTSNMFTYANNLLAPNAEDQTIIASEEGLDWKNEAKCTLPFTLIFDVANSITLPTPNANNDYSVNWGDGTIESITTINPTHNYTSSGDYTITIMGHCEIFNFGAVPTSRFNLKSIASWGDVGLTTFSNMFKGCIYLEISTATGDIPNNITEFNSMFEGCTNITCISSIDTTNQTSTTDMFNNTNSLISPNALEKAAISSGSNWVGTVFCTEPFVTVFRTANDGDSITLPTNSSSNNYSVDWGDNSAIEYVNTNTPPIHTYGVAGDYTVSIKGHCPTWSFYSVSASRYNLIEIKQWGDIGIISFYRSFYYCRYLTVISCLDSFPKNISSFYYAFYNCTSLTCMTSIDTTKATSTYRMFYACYPTDPDNATRTLIEAGLDWVNPNPCPIPEEE